VYYTWAICSSRSAAGLRAWRWTLYAVLMTLTFSIAAGRARRCRADKGIDVCVAFDASAAIGQVGLDSEKMFVSKLYDSFDSDATRIATYAYSAAATLVSTLSNDFPAGKDAVRKYNLLDGTAQAVLALAGCNATLAGVDAQQRQRIIFLFVHGPESFSGRITETASSIKNRSINVACIAIRNSSAANSGLPDVDAIAYIASTSTKYGRPMVYFVDIGNALAHNSVQTVIRQTCSVVGKLPGPLGGWAIAAIVLGVLAFMLVVCCALFCMHARSPY
jgi:von Willebrand factor type A domain